MRLFLKDSSDIITEATEHQALGVILKMYLGTIQNWAWFVCSLFSFWENDQNVRSTVISSRPTDYQAYVYLEGLWGLQFSQQPPKKNTKTLVRKCKYLSELVSAQEAP